MKPLLHICKYAVTAILLSTATVAAQTAEPLSLEEMMAQLSDPDTQNWQQLERQIRREWSRSGSTSMDYLLQRGEKALEEEDFTAALEHFTALTDHAPNFAPGWNGRATALFRLKHYGPALEDLGKVLALNPDHFEAMTGLAVVLQSIGMEQEALEAWYLVEQVHPHRQEMKDAIKALEARVGGTSL